MVRNPPTRLLLKAHTIFIIREARPLLLLEPLSLAKTVQCLAQVKVRVEQLWNDNYKGKPKYPGKNLSKFLAFFVINLFSTTIPTWIEVESNPDLGNEMLATYRLNHSKTSLAVTDQVACPYGRTSNVTRL